MMLTKNEKKTLKMLLENSRITDSEIAAELGITSQAVGKIRRKLEQSIIDSYTINLNAAKLGIRTYAMAIARLTREGMDKGELEVEEHLLKNAHIISVYRLPSSSSTHMILFGFKDLDELDTFFHSQSAKQNLHNYIEINELFTFSHNSLVKNSPKQLLHKAIDNLGASTREIRFKELENYKRRIA
ncbi:MAG: Lrp/AsnC family transcriptional regulator [Candidatus Woesearchaeota archaeon]